MTRHYERLRLLNNRTAENMKISINGKELELTGPQPLAGVIQDVCKNNPHVIAEMNGNIISNDLWQGTQVCEGDRIELVSFVGGG